MHSLIIHIPNASTDIPLNDGYVTHQLTDEILKQLYYGT
jgi:hypothetical protein